MTQHTPLDTVSHEDVGKILDRIRQRTEADANAAEIFNPSELSAQIETIARELGDKPDSNVVSEVVEGYMHERLSFVPPEKGLGYVAALGWVHRKAIGITLAAAVVTTTGVLGATSMYEAHKLEQSERAVEAQALDVCQGLDTVAELSTATRKIIELSTLPKDKKARADADIQEGVLSFVGTQNFRDSVCRDPVLAVTGENYQEIQNNVEGAKAASSRSAKSFQDAQQIVNALRESEAHTEQYIGTVCKNIEEVRRKPQLLTSDATSVGLNRAAKSKFELFVNQGSRSFGFLNTFYTENCRDMSSMVTMTNWAEMEREGKVVAQEVSQVDSAFLSANGILQDQRTLISVASEIDPLYNRIAATSGDAVVQNYKAKARVMIQQGRDALANDNAQMARRSLDELRTLETTLGLYTTEKPRFDSLYSNVMNLAQEQRAKTEVERLYAEGNQAIARSDFTALKGDITELEGLERALNTEYDIMLTTVDIPGKRGQMGMKVAWDGSERDAAYLFVKAASHGRDGVMKIRDSRSGRTVETSVWVVRVPDQVYQRVKEDKVSDGVVDNLDMGKKRRGYLSITYKDPVTVEITSWNDLNPQGGR